MRLDFFNNFAYTCFMSKIYISELASPQLTEYLKNQGHNIILTRSLENVAPAISWHPDIIHCHLAAGIVFHGNPDKPGPDYPADVIYNACSTGKYFIHNLKYTAPELLEAAENMDLKMIHVPQGYARCSICVVDEDSIITYDRGIAAACALRAPALNVLLVSPGHIELPGYAAGFIGGTGGRVGSAILFNGDLSAHPDFENIKEFIESRGLECVWFTDIPLTDIGSVIEEK